MRITKVRVAVQAVSLSLFVFFVFITQFAYLKGWPVSLFLEVDPLVALATTLATGRVYQFLIWSLVLILPTMLLGRFFCNWICPMGITLQVTGYLFNRQKSEKDRIDQNRHRPLFKLKYYILAFILVAACFGSLQNGLLDPIPTIHRAFSIAVLPVAEMAAPGTFYVRPHLHQVTWLVGATFLFFLVMNAVIPRFFCRTLCPLGALLGWLSRFSLIRIDRDVAKCTDCDLCLKACEGAADPHAALRKSECFVCFNCLEDCPEGALSYAWLAQAHAPDRGGEIPGPVAERRGLALAALSGFLFYAFGRTSGDTSENFKPEVIRPPGSVPEDEFLARCIKCDQCIRVCPTNVLQPAALEAGIEGLWTPIMNMRMGYCELNCTLCGQVCPTGAIQKISIDQKLGRGQFADAGAVVVGTAFYDRGRCLPWAMDTPCVVCEEVCPVSPKAIFTRDVEIADRWGQTLKLEQPYIDPVLCIGCGICEHECPVVDDRAVYVTAVGESRSKERSLLLNESAASPQAGPASGRGITEIGALTDLLQDGRV